MLKKFIVKLMFMTMFLSASVINADADQIVYVAVNDPFVISVANFAVEEIKNGSLFEILSAQKQGTEDIKYILTIEVVDAHVKHHNYIVEVLIPAEQKPWQLEYFSPINY